MALINITEFKVLGDARGQLIALEENKNIPFEIKRVYYLTGTLPDVARGFHAHKKLRQMAVCVSGKCKMLMDDGATKEAVWLDTPNKAILIEPMIWHEMHEFSGNCVLLVLANDYYDESDYIRNYNEFISQAKSASNSPTV